MPSMVNANRFINMGAIPLVIVAYAVFLLIDYSNHNSHNIDPASSIESIQSIQGIQKIGSVDGLVFGGSNAVYSLSAESLSYLTGIKWYNAAVLQEAEAIERHKNFIQEISARIDRMTVRYVVYSSVTPYTSVIPKAKITEKGLGIKPKDSVLRYIAAYFRHSPRRPDPQRNNFGDIVFDSVECDFTTEDNVKHERNDEDAIVNILVDYTIFFASLFPNASILIVLPSEYYGGLSFDDSIFEQTLRAKFYSVLNTKYFKNTIIKIIFQPPYSSIAQVCNQKNHANEDGRLWRTRNLIESMR